MLVLETSNEGFVFSVEFDGKNIDYKEWIDTDDCIYYLPLSALVDNGYASVSGTKCIVPFEYVYMLDNEERLILGLPSLYNKSMRLRSEDTLNSSSFMYKLEYLTHVPDGELYNAKVFENIIEIEGVKYLLSEPQYKLNKLVVEYNGLEVKDKNFENNLRQFACIKELAYKANCELDSYLENENVFVPEKVKIEVGADCQGYTIDPSVEIEEKDQFARTFDRMRSVQGIYPVQNSNGSRTRVVLSPEQKQCLEILKKDGGRHKSKESIQKLTENAIEYFDPDVFDLSELYSDRVIEIGVYKPKFYPFVSPYKSEWIVGANIETLENGTSRITIESESDLNELLNSIEEAEDNAKDIVDFRNTQIALEDAKFLASSAEKQLMNSQQPIEEITNIEQEEKSGIEKKVLIIEENAEELNFQADHIGIGKSNKYALYPNKYLQNNYSLKTHQEEGVAWLQYLYNNNASGCLMADDMGLGKTLQILYFIDWHSRVHPDHKPYLIVAPVSLLENWENEYNRFFMQPRLRIARLTSKDVPRFYNKEIIDELQKMDVILTNYESLRNSQLNFCAVEFDVVALDEAQKIKTPGTLVTNAAKALKSNFKIAMTGTPVENTLLDLWCIMDFCVPGLLGNAKTFASKYQNPLKNEDTDIIALGNEIHELLGVYFMRRLKKDAAKDLPHKIEIKDPKEMPMVQRKCYLGVMDDYLKGIQPNMLVTIMNIREVSEHPFLYNSSLLDHDSQDLIESSARLLSTIRILHEIKQKNEKVILFAERKDTQKMLQKICKEYFGIVAKIINGDSPTTTNQITFGKQSRQACIDEFQAKPGFNIIIMSPIAAGMGLNVTAANHVIHYSRHWNPAKESQATDRAYRIGQTKDVFVYYPMAVCVGMRTFDQTLDDLLSRKTELATSTIFPTERVEVKQEELFKSLL